MWQMNSSKLRLLFAVAALAFPLAASAQFYASAAVGQVWQDFECQPALTRCDDSDTGFKLLGGYKFTPLIAAEVVYVDYGKVTIGDAFFTQSFAVTSFGAGVALHGDFAQSWSWLARAGLAQVKVDMNSSSAFGGASADDSILKLYFGGGISYRFSKQFSLDLSLDFTEATFDLNNGNRRDWDITALWLGVTYTFR
jgi:OOP family OmpA-OmpF porin